jgi:hypothetical protein
MSMTVRIKANIDHLQAQLAEARALLEQAPEGVRSNFVDAILKCVASLSFEAQDVAPDPAGGTNGLIVYRAIAGADFDRLMSALRAKQFDFI